MTAALVLETVSAGYRADLPIVRGVSLSVAQGEVLALLGPNGAGKSTLMKAISGLVPHVTGAIRLGPKAIEGLAPETRAASGIGTVPQVRNVFTTLTVDDNLRAGGYGLPGALLRQRLEEAYARFPDLADRRRALGGTLSGGQRQMLAIARTLMMRPSVLLLDEPSAGLSPIMASGIFSSVRTIAAGGVAVLMVEQNVRSGLGAADRGIVMVQGEIVLDEPAAQLATDPRLKAAFLGEKVTA